MSEERKIIEAILLLADEPVPASLMGEVLERPKVEVEGLLKTLADSYSGQAIINLTLTTDF